MLGGHADGQALRLASDGSAQRFGRVGYAALAITATADGVIATAETHYPHRIDFWDREFNPLGSIDDFTANNTDVYYAPSAVEATPSGWFYAIDQHRRRGGPAEARRRGPAHHPHRARLGRHLQEGPGGVAGGRGARVALHRLADDGRGRTRLCLEARPCARALPDLPWPPST
ncbi:hypothetical protein AB0H69_00835 [Streptomyces phaeochromogenes]|uniref:hypothetical protein n=1 Tax=Streptomyces phaeochromogenes TaxID=1923 RepID=UPI003408FDE3